MFDLSGMTALVTGASGGIGSAMARAMPTRAFWPPDIWCGNRSSRSSGKPTCIASSSQRARSFAPPLIPPICMIGSAIARALGGQGVRLAVSGSDQAKLDAFRESLGGEHVALTCDLADAAQVDGLVPRAVEALGGRLDILVNNAGVTRDNLAMRMKDEEWSDVIRINLEAAFRLIRAAARPMMKARFGRIVSITSVVGTTGNPGQANYAASKGGLTAMSKALAQELAGRGITVNCVAPGFIASAMTDALSEQQKAAILARIPAAALGSGADVAAAVVYLASREAGYVTGQTLHVNGGMAMI